MLTNSPPGFRAFTKNHGGAVAVTLPSALCPLPQVLLFFCCIAIAWGMKFAFEIKTKPVTQATIIIGVVPFFSRSLATIAVYLGYVLARIVCAIILAVIVYLSLCLAPC